MKNELKRYIKEINKGLHLPHKMKKRITTELLSEIYGRIDDGEELNSVLTSIGTPQELVEELEANYEHEYVQFKKGNILKLTIYSIIAFGISALIIYSAIVIIYPQFIHPTIIGGANGSTAVFIAYKWSAKELIGGLIIQIIILIFVLSRIVRIFTLLKNKKGVPRKRRKML